LILRGFSPNQGTKRACRIKSLQRNSQPKPLAKTKAVRSVLADWGLGEQATTALVDILIALLRHDYSFQALHDMLVQVEMNLDDEFNPECAQ
jgi:hypothetical protein